MEVNKGILIAVGIIIIVLCGLVIYYSNKAHNNTVGIIETTQQEGKYVQYYDEREFNSLKKENRELYDSLKKQKKEIESLAQFQYKVKYITDTVFITHTEQIPEPVKDLPDKTFSYNSESDTLSYNLEINSKIEPNWYKLSAEIKDKFTIVNKDYGNGMMATVIESENKGEVSDITAWQKPKKAKWYNRFTLGPTVSVGYDPINNNVGVVVGIGVTYNILK